MAAVMWAQSCMRQYSHELCTEVAYNAAQRLDLLAQLKEVAQAHGQQQGKQEEQAQGSHSSSGMHTSAASAPEPTDARLSSPERLPKLAQRLLGPAPQEPEPEHVVTLLHSLASFGHYHPLLYSTAAARLSQELDLLELESLVQLAWSYSVTLQSAAARASGPQGRAKRRALKKRESKAGEGAESGSDADEAAAGAGGAGVAVSRGAPPSQAQQAALQAHLQLLAGVQAMLHLQLASAGPRPGAHGLTPRELLLLWQAHQLCLNWAEQQQGQQQGTGEGCSTQAHVQAPFSMEPALLAEGGCKHLVALIKCAQLLHIRTTPLLVFPLCSPAPGVPGATHLHALAPTPRWCYLLTHPRSSYLPAVHPQPSAWRLWSRRPTGGGVPLLSWQLPWRPRASPPWAVGAAVTMRSHQQGPRWWLRNR